MNAMGTLSNLDLFGLLMTAAMLFALPLAWLAGRDDPVKEGLARRRHECSWN
jgi:hypothetical protein